VTSIYSPIFTDARRYFKQSEIILYRQAPDAAPVQGQGTQSLPINPDNKIAAIQA
jgi:vacuolar protein sorting-associated protein 26